MAVSKGLILIGGENPRRKNARFRSHDFRCVSFAQSISVITSVATEPALQIAGCGETLTLARLGVTIPVSSPLQRKRPPSRPGGAANACLSPPRRHG
jgi:hypothetical protein